MGTKTKTSDVSNGRSDFDIGRVCIRWMIRRDMPSVLDIENTTVAPWSEEDFLECLKQRNAIGICADIDLSGKAPGYRDRDDELFLGYMIYELHKTRLHLVNFAVHPDYRRLGVGRKLVEKLKAKLSYQRRTRIITEVREKNLAAQLFFKACDFRAVTVIREFYDDEFNRSGESSPEDAYLFSYRHREEM